MSDLQNKSIAMLVANYIEEPELVQVKQQLEESGAAVHIIAIEESDQVQTMQNDVEMASKQQVDHTLDEIDIDEYDALVVPGGTVNADNLRVDESAQQAVTSFLQSGKPTALICHAPWLLVSADQASGRRLTSFPSLQDDLRNAGADWTDEEVVTDGNLITSRNPDDIPAFSEAIIKALG